MIRWKQRQLDRYGVSIALLILTGLGFLVARTGAEGLQPVEVLRVVSVWGFAEELIFTSVGLIVLAFMAGRGKNGPVAIGGIVLLLLANSTMAGPANLIPNYPTAIGIERETLLFLAETDPHPPIYEEIPVVLRMGEVLGNARLIIPLFDFADRIRAFTDVDVISEIGPYDFPVDNLPELGEEVSLGLLGAIPVSVIGKSDEYVWLNAPDGIYIVARELLVDSTS